MSRSAEPAQQNSQNAPHGGLALLLTVIGVLSRLLPHPANFTAVGAASLFSGARLKTWQAYLVPLSILAVTDPILNAYYGFPLFSRYVIFSYIGFFVSVWIGTRLRGTESVVRIGGACVLSSVQFFVITNFGSWLIGLDYPHTFAGLVQCYTMAIPFFRTTFLSDLLFTAVLFGLHAWLTRLAGSHKRAVAA